MKNHLRNFAYSENLISIQAPCYEGFSALEEMQQKLINDLQQQHQKEVAALLKEKDQQLKEETAATVTGEEYEPQNNKTRALFQILTHSLNKHDRYVESFFFLHDTSLTQGCCARLKVGQIFAAIM